MFNFTLLQLPHITKHTLVLFIQVGVGGLPWDYLAYGWFPRCHLPRKRFHFNGNFVSFNLLSVGRKLGLNAE